jgi:arsenate reductase
VLFDISDYLRWFQGRSVHFIRIAGYTQFHTSITDRIKGMNVTIYHNPRCSKSRQTLVLLQDRNFEPEIIEYLKTPPDKATLKSILKKLGLSARQLIRTGESAYTENNLDDDSLDEDQLIEAMIANPILIERPIVLANDRAAIGRPPESVLDIL